MFQGLCGNLSLSEGKDADDAVPCGLERGTGGDAAGGQLHIAEGSAGGLDLVEDDAGVAAHAHSEIWRAGCCMAQRENCFVKCRDEYAGLPGVFRALRAGRKKKYLFTFAQWVGRNFVKCVEYYRKICERRPMDIP